MTTKDTIWRIICEYCYGDGGWWSTTWSMHDQPDWIACEDCNGTGITKRGQK